LIETGEDVGKLEKLVAGLEEKLAAAKAELGKKVEAQSKPEGTKDVEKKDGGDSKRGRSWW
jgi:hypothetical protein